VSSSKYPQESLVLYASIKESLFVGAGNCFCIKARQQPVAIVGIRSDCSMDHTRLLASYETQIAICMMANCSYHFKGKSF